jgi:hypothetical protein
VAAASGGDVVGLVDDEEVEAARVGGFTLGREEVAEEAEGALALEIVDRGDEARVVVPRVDVGTSGAPELAEEGGVDDLELEAEFVAHLVAPLDLEARRADDEDGADAVAEGELLDDEASFDGLAEADVVSDEEVDARHLKGPRYRVELVVLDGDAAAEGGVEDVGVRGGDGRPTHCVEEGALDLGAIKAACGIREGGALVSAGGDEEWGADDKIGVDTRGAPVWALGVAMSGA